MNTRYMNGFKNQFQTSLKLVFQIFQMSVSFGYSWEVNMNINPIWHRSYKECIMKVDFNQMVKECV